MARKKESEASTGHMPRSGTCKKNPGGVHTPKVVNRRFEQVIDPSRGYPRRSHAGLYVTESTVCSGCGKVGGSWNRHVGDAEGAPALAELVGMFQSGEEPVHAVFTR